MSKKPTYKELKQKVKELEKAYDELEWQVEERTGELIAINKQLQQEIIERQQAQEQLALFHQFVEASREGMGWADLDGRVRYINSTLCSMFGETKPKDSYGRPVLEYYSEETQQQLQEEIFPTVLREGTWTGELVIHSSRGNLIPTTNSLFVLRDAEGNPSSFANVLTDLTGRKKAEEELRRHRNNLEELVAKRTSSLKKSNQKLQQEITERKQAEKTLKESEATLRSILRAAPTGIGMVRDRVIKQANERLCEMLGYSHKELLEKSSRILYPTDVDYEYVGREKYEQIQKKGTGTVETRWQKKNGEVIDVLLSSTPIDPDDLSVGVTFTALDITEGKLAEAERIRLATAIEQAAESVVITDRKGTIQYVNPVFERLSGFNHKELVGQNFRLFKSDKHDESFYHDMWNIISNGKVWTGRIINRMMEDILREFETTISPVKNSSGEIINFVSVNRDVTQEVALEAKLQRAQKMEALGLLAGGVAHDLNNVLSGIVSYPELILMDLPEDSKLKKPIETMQESGHRAAAIVQDLLTVARGVATTKEPLNLNDQVGDYLNSPEFEKLEHFHPTVTVKTNLGSDLFNVSGSHVHIRKVVMNLVSNASEAIKGRGNVTISTMNRYVDRPLRGYDTVTIGEYAVLSVSDDGLGISSVDLERIFEPFYTKKIMGRSGTGLGLAVVWNVVQDHKGYINVASGQNGTTFELYFPITREKISGKDLAIPIGDLKGDGETILVVDDVKSQREISCEMLNTLGYKAKAVSSGEEAVDYLKEHSVDLILLDMIMEPGINGRETYERIIKMHPNQKAIIASGFAETDDVKEAQKLGAGQYIKKPLTLGKMGIALRDELKK